MFNCLSARFEPRLFVISTIPFRNRHLYPWPSLQPRVFVHAHDIFLPFEYPLSWVRDKKWFWTEQHFLQAFLAFNSAFEVVLALRYMHAYHRQALAQAAPVLARYPFTKPGSLWMRRKME